MKPDDRPHPPTPPPIRCPAIPVRSIIRVFSLGVIGVCAMTIVGHASGSRWLLHWGYTPGMAINTAACLFLLAANFLLLTRRED